MLAGRIPEAKALLVEMRARHPQSQEMAFLFGQIAVHEGDYDQAIALFREMLAREPNLARVRLELGRAFFLKEDDENAEYQFRYALAGNLPPAVVTNVEGYLERIRRRKRWAIDLAVSVAPDSNVNAAPAIQTIDLFGQTFTLSDDARERSGIGLSASLGAQAYHPLTDGAQFRVGVNSCTSEYANSDFDDYVLPGFAGPRFVFSDGDLSVLATVNRRWYGGEPYSRAVGWRIEATRRITSRWALGGAAEWQDVRYDANPFADGPLITANASISYALTPSSFVRALAGVARERAKAEALRNTSFRIGLGYHQDLPWGISAYVQPEIITTEYDAPGMAFGETRRDRLIRLRTSLMNRRWQVFGFAPVLSHIYSYRESTIGLYD